MCGHYGWDEHACMRINLLTGWDIRLNSIQVVGGPETRRFVIKTKLFFPTMKPDLIDTEIIAIIEYLEVFFWLALNSYIFGIDFNMWRSWFTSFSDWHQREPNLIILKILNRSWYGSKIVDFVELYKNILIKY